MASNQDILNVTYSVDARRLADYYKEHCGSDVVKVRLVALARRLIKAVPAYREAGVSQEDIICGALLELLRDEQEAGQKRAYAAVKAQQQATVNALKHALTEVAGKPHIQP